MNESDRKRDTVTKAHEWLGTQPIYIKLYDNSYVQIGQRMRCAAKISDDPGGHGLQVYKTGSYFLHISPDEGETGIVWNKAPEIIREGLPFRVEREDGTILTSGRMRISNTNALTPGSIITPALTLPL